MQVTCPHALSKMLRTAFTALTMFVGRYEGQSPCKNLSLTAIPNVFFWRFVGGGT